VKAGERVHLLFYFMTITFFFFLKELPGKIFRNSASETLSPLEFYYCVLKNFYCTFNVSTKTFLKHVFHINWHIVSRLYSEKKLN